jgi:bacterioferritin
VLSTTKPNSIAVHVTTEQMLKANVHAEEEAITLYKDIIRHAVAEDDDTIERLFKEILDAEERHHDTFTTLLS